MTLRYIHKYAFLFILFDSFLIADSTVVIKRPRTMKANGLTFLRQQCSGKPTYFRLPAEHDKHAQLLQNVHQLTKIKRHDQATTTFNYKVNVLLDKTHCHQRKEWQLHSEHGFLLQSLTQPHQKKMIRSQELTINVRAGTFSIKNVAFTDDVIMIRPLKEPIRFCSNTYQGSFFIAQQEAHCYLINQLDIEDYMYSVLRWESWPGWPVEVNKAFAIACRSYLINKVLDANKQNRLYHIKNSNTHQTYNGLHKDYTIKKAIESTKGLILTYNKKPIEAMFDCCCGGIIPAKLDYIDFKKAPYLARNYPCTFCKSCKIYSWQFSIDVDALSRLLNQAGRTIKTIKISKRDQAGTVKELTIKDAKGIHHITGKQFYSLLPKIKSYYYTLDRKGNTITIKGRGYGHHVGICQWGARNMIDAGWNYRSILSFYYPGAVIMELKNAKAS